MNLAREENLRIVGSLGFTNHKNGVGITWIRTSGNFGLMITLIELLSRYHDTILAGSSHEEGKLFGKTAVSIEEGGSRIDQFLLSKGSKLICSQSVDIILKKGVFPSKLWHFVLDSLDQCSVLNRLGSGRISGAMSCKDLSKGDIAAVWYIGRRYLGVNGEEGRILTPIVRDS